MLRPTEIRTLRELASQCISSRRKPVAIEILGVYLQHEPKDWAVWSLFGDLLLSVGRISESIDAFERSVKGQADVPSYLWARFALRMRNLAAMQRPRRTSLEPQDCGTVAAWIWEDWAKSLMKVGRLSEARARIEVLPPHRQIVRRQRLWSLATSWSRCANTHPPSEPTVEP